MALGAAGYLFFTIEQDIAFRRETLRSFDRRAREVASALADMRAAEQAYVAAGQGTDFWMPKVAALLADVAPRVDALRPSAATIEARSALMEAAALVTEFGNIDRRARDYLRSGQTLMAGDVVFSEGGETTAAAVRQVESARLAENRGFDLAEARLGRRQAAVMGGAAGFSVLVLLALAVAAPKPREEARGGDEAPAEAAGELMLREPAARPTPAIPLAAGSNGAPHGPVSPASPVGNVPLLKAAAELCTDFGRLTDSRDLTRLLSRVATVMDASGVVVWLGDHPGADLRPVFAHGYSDQALARMTATAIPRAADNAVAAAYRSETLQVVLSRPGASNGAVVAPLLTPEGCIGAFTAELLAGRETSEAVQAIASLFAAQLTGVLAASVQRAESPATQRVVSR